MYLTDGEEERGEGWWEVVEDALYLNILFMLVIVFLYYISFPHQDHPNSKWSNTRNGRRTNMSRGTYKWCGNTDLILAARCLWRTEQCSPRSLNRFRPTCMGSRWRKSTISFMRRWVHTHITQALYEVTPFESAKSKHSMRPAKAYYHHHPKTQGVATRNVCALYKCSSSIKNRYFSCSSKGELDLYQMSAPSWNIESWWWFCSSCPEQKYIIFVSTFSRDQRSRARLLKVESTVNGKCKYIVYFRWCIVFFLADRQDEPRAPIYL